MLPEQLRALLLAAFVPRAGAETQLVVALDGSGQFTSVQAAISNAPLGSAAHPAVIHIKPGTYRELIYVQREKRFLHLLGDDSRATILSFNLFASLPGSDGRPIGTFRTPSAWIDADDFVAENITFENSAGPKGQALAARIDGDRVAFRHCRFLGWQDTILDNRGRHYYEDCDISGHVDFIFGAGTAWFENCRLHCLGNGYITAASTPCEEPFGFVFDHCAIWGDQPGSRTFLGRPWRPCAAVCFIHCEMDGVVRPEGWNNWRDPAREKTVRYFEFQSTGAGGNPSARVGWARQLTETEAAAWTIERVLGGPDHWRPALK